MSNNVFRIDTISPLTGSTVGINGVNITGTSPATNQLLTTSSSTSADWQTGVSSLRSASNTINVSNSNPPSVNDIFITSNTTSAFWQSISSQLKTPVRTATTQNETLTDVSAGNTIDDIVLVIGDRILINYQTTETENGIYTVNANGVAPTRSSDFDTASNQANSFVFVQEGTINNGKGFVCRNIDGSDTVGTDNINFDIFADIGTTSVFVNNIEGFLNALTNGIPYIKIASGTFTITDNTPITINSNTTIEGSGFDNTTIFVNLSEIPDSPNILFTIQDNCTFKNLAFRLGTAPTSSVVPSANMFYINSSNFKSINVKYYNFNGLSEEMVGLSLETRTLSLFTIDSASNVLFQNSHFNDCFLNTPALISIEGTSSIIQFKYCKFVNIDGNDPNNSSCISVDNTVDNVLISNCYFDSNEIGLQFAENTSTIVKNCYFRDNSRSILSPNNRNSIYNSNTFINSSSINSFASTTVHNSNTYIEAPLNGVSIELSSTNAGFIFNNNILLDNIQVSYSNTGTNYTTGILSNNYYSDNINTSSPLNLTNPYNYNPNVDALILTINNIFNRIINFNDLIDETIIGNASLIDLQSADGFVSPKLTYQNVNTPNTGSMITNAGQINIIINTSIIPGLDLYIDSSEYSTDPTTSTLILPNYKICLVDTGNYGFLVFEVDN